MAPLEDILTDLNTALRRADFDSVAAFSAMLETEFPPNDPAALHHIARLACENMDLAAASIRGVKAANRRLAELRAAPTLSTYDRTGRRTERAPATTETKRI